MKKALTMSLFLILLNMVFAQQFWLNMPTPTTKNLTKILFVDTLYGWASGDSGTIIYTTNGGGNWSVQNTGITSFQIDDSFFLNRRLGWAVSNDFLSNGTKILKTTNGGLNWQLSVFPDTTQFISAIHFLDSLTGFIGGYGGKIYKTTNGGVNWFNCYFDSIFCPIFKLFPKTNLSFLNSQTGYICGGIINIQGVIWKTTNSGLNWFSFCVTPEPLRRIKVLYPHKIIAAGGNYSYGAITSQSTDSGKTWIYDVLNLQGLGYALAYRTPRELWIPLGFSKTWGLSLDSGNTTGFWFQIPTPDSAAIYDAQFVTPTFGFGCGEKGALVKYNSAIVGMTNNGNTFPKRYKVFQNYPNPFNPSTRISYYLHSKSAVKITVYDLLGKEVRLFNEGIKPAGYYRSIFLSGGLASGVYFYVMEALPLDPHENVYIESRKMVILK